MKKINLRHNILSCWITLACCLYYLQNYECEKEIYYMIASIAGLLVVAPFELFVLTLVYNVRRKIPSEITFLFKKVVVKYE